MRSTRRYLDWYSGLDNEDLSRTLMEGVRTLAPPARPASIPGENIIFFGSPGTGKSHEVKGRTASFVTVLTTAFHPDYAYADFVGAYKAVCGSEPGSNILSYDGHTLIPRPVVYYEFDPGICIQAIVAAVSAPDQTVALVIDEISRGDCAAIFGDFLHLLDRDSDGRGSYAINVGVPLGKYLTAAGVLSSPNDTLRLPANLHILATMNTSDQAIFPMDSAFKRRWSWRAVSSSGAEHPQLAEAVLEQDPAAPPVKWLAFVEWLNGEILKLTENEDKRIGPWYIKPREGRIAASDIREKLLHFLWFDVFKGRSDNIFVENLRSFDAVQNAFDTRGINGVLRQFRLATAETINSPASTSEGNPNSSVT